MQPFACDIDRETHMPSISLAFANGWCANLLFYEPSGIVSYNLCRVAAWPCDDDTAERRQILEQEADADEAAQLLAQVRSWNAPSTREMS